MRPPDPKQELAAAFISNCAAKSIRLYALDALSASLDVHSYGGCRHNADTAQPKSAVLRKYHFSLAFENSQVAALAPPVSAVPSTGNGTLM